MSDWSGILQTLKIVYNIISKSESMVVTCSAIFSLETFKIPFLDIYPWHWNHHPSILTIILVFFSFRNGLLSMFGNVSTSQTSSTTILILFYDFSLILLQSFIQHGQTFHIWKYTLDPENSTPNIIHNIEHHPPLFLWFFLIFLFSIATLSIFGNAHCTLKELPNIITNSKHNPLLYCHFSSAKAPISIFGSALKTVPDVVTNSEHHCWAHNAPYSPAQVIATGAKKWQVFC